MPFAIKIHNTNACTAYCRHGSKKWEANPDPKTNWDWVRLPGGERALFATELEAQSVGLACRWGNQLYSVHVVRGTTNTKVTMGTPTPMVSCQN